VLKVKSDPKVYNVIKTDINIICLRQRETENNILNIEYPRLDFVRVDVVDQVLMVCVRAWIEFENGKPITDMRQRAGNVLVQVSM
jgi:hypothetical protein